MTDDDTGRRMMMILDDNRSQNWFPLFMSLESGITASIFSFFEFEREGELGRYLFSLV